MDHYSWRDIPNEFFGFLDPEAASFLRTFFTILVVVFIIGLACSLAFYILRSIGLMRIAQNRGMAHPWLPWIPLFGTFMIGAVADDISEKQTGGKTYFRFFLLGGMILGHVIAIAYAAVALSSMFQVFSSYGRNYPETFLAVAPIVNLLQYPISIATLVLTLISLNKIYKCYTPGNATAFTILSFFFGFLISIFLFALRNREPVPPAWPPAPGYYPPPNYTPEGYVPPYQPGYPPPPNYPPPGYMPPQPIEPNVQSSGFDDPPPAQ